MSTRGSSSTRPPAAINVADGPSNSFISDLLFLLRLHDNDRKQFVDFRQFALGQCRQAFSVKGDRFFIADFVIGLTKKGLQAAETG